VPLNVPTEISATPLRAVSNSAHRGVAADGGALVSFGRTVNVNFDHFFSPQSAGGKLFCHRIEDTVERQRGQPCKIRNV